MIRVFFLIFSSFFTLAGCPLNTIYKSSFKKCYKFVNQSLSFLAAEQFCVGLGGHLVAISNGFEASTILVDVIGTSQSLSYWIGANYLLAPNWSWTFNTPFSYSNWAPGQPADPSSTQCGAVRTPDNYWTKELCFSLKPFICSIDPNAVVSPTCQPTPVSTTISPNCPPEPTGNSTCSGKCPASYIMGPVDCKCYSWNSTVGTFNEAFNNCKLQGSSLVKITSAAQNKWFIDWIISLKIDYISPFIDLSYPRTTKDSCYWTDGSSVACYDNFDTITYDSIAYSKPKIEYLDWQLGSYDPNFFVIPFPSDSDYNMWIRAFARTVLAVICMRDPY